jgi:hypothetical protein
MKLLSVKNTYVALLVAALSIPVLAEVQSGSQLEAAKANKLTVLEKAFVKLASFAGGTISGVHGAFISFYTENFIQAKKNIDKIPERALLEENSWLNLGIDQAVSDYEYALRSNPNASFDEEMKDACARAGNSRSKCEAIFKQKAIALRNSIKSNESSDGFEVVINPPTKPVTPPDTPVDTGGGGNPGGGGGCFPCTTGEN